eukprot:2631313-Pleurochrysis_carterae.AAC.2
MAVQPSSLSSESESLSSSAAECARADALDVVAAEVDRGERFVLAEHGAHTDEFGRLVLGLWVVAVLHPAELAVGEVERQQRLCGGERVAEVARALGTQLLRRAVHDAQPAQHGVAAGFGGAAARQSQQMLAADWRKQMLLTGTQWCKRLSWRGQQLALSKASQLAVYASKD